jgi:Legionella pneumophila major outer membrane protein precursor
MQKGPRPRVARLRIGGEPHNARTRRVGFDWQAQPLWHVNGQFRYGTVSKSKPTNSVFTSGSTVITTTGTQHLQEDHWLVDFGIGRDFGIGSNAMWTLGVRVADLRSKLNTNAQTVGTTSGSPIEHGVVTAVQRSTFVGAGPRFGVQGNTPLGGSWSFDWLAGAAVLFGERSGQVNSTTVTTLGAGAL